MIYLSETIMTFTWSFLFNMQENNSEINFEISKFANLSLKPTMYFCILILWNYSVLFHLCIYTGFSQKNLSVICYKYAMTGFTDI